MESAAVSSRVKLGEDGEAKISRERWSTLDRLDDEHAAVSMETSELKSFVEKLAIYVEKGRDETEIAADDAIAQKERIKLDSCKVRYEKELRGIAENRVFVEEVVEVRYKGDKDDLRARLKQYDSDANLQVIRRELGTIRDQAGTQRDEYQNSLDRFEVETREFYERNIRLLEENVMFFEDPAKLLAEKQKQLSELEAKLEVRKLEVFAEREKLSQEDERKLKEVRGKLDETLTGVSSTAVHVDDVPKAPDWKKDPLGAAKNWWGKLWVKKN